MHAPVCGVPASVWLRLCVHACVCVRVCMCSCVWLWLCFCIQSKMSHSEHFLEVQLTSLLLCPFSITEQRRATPGVRLATLTLVPSLAFHPNNLPPF